MRTPVTLGTFLLVMALGLPMPSLAQRSPAIVSPHLDAQVLSLACAPLATTAAPTSTLSLTGGQDTGIRQSYTQGDFVTINAGKNQGMQIGQEFYVRRLVVERGTRVSPETPATTKTAGWIRIYATDDDMSLATVTHACDTLSLGDYLEPFGLPTPLKAEATRGKPDRDYGRILAGDDRRQDFAPGDYFVLNRGTDHGIAKGSQFVVYRWKTKAPDNFLAAIGEAVAVEVQGTTATLRVVKARDALAVNDLVAMRKEQAAQ